MSRFLSALFDIAVALVLSAALIGIAYLSIKWG